MSVAQSHALPGGSSSRMQPQLCICTHEKFYLKPMAMFYAQQTKCQLCLGKTMENCMWDAQTIRCCRRLPGQFGSKAGAALGWGKNDEPQCSQDPFACTGLQLTCSSAGMHDMQTHRLI